jgi:hypothetical protein
VLSVMQTDIISYAANLTSYIRHEFAGEPTTNAHPTVAFWRDLTT